MFVLWLNASGHKAKDIPELRQTLLSLSSQIFEKCVKSYITVEQSDGYVGEHIFDTKAVRNMVHTISKIDSDMATIAECAELCNQFAILRANNKEESRQC
jgi:hypothetical protein